MIRLAFVFCALKSLLHFKETFQIGFVDFLFAVPLAGDVVFQEFHSEHGHRFTDSRNLRDHLKAILLFFHHPAHTLQLSLDARDAREHR